MAGGGSGVIELKTTWIRRGSQLRPDSLDIWAKYMRVMMMYRTTNVASTQLGKTIDWKIGSLPFMLSFPVLGKRLLM